MHRRLVPSVCRDVINKGLTEEVILEGAGMAFEGGWNKVKLYFMLGLPTETEEDMKAIAELANEIAVRYYETFQRISGMGNARSQFQYIVFCAKAFYTVPVGINASIRRTILRRAKVVNDTVKEQLNRKEHQIQLA